MSKHPSVLDAAVIAIKDNNVVKHLSCFYSEKSFVGSSELRKHLKAYVPYYMIPSYFYRLAEIPLSPTGKVDRNRLHSMDNVDLAESDTPYEEPVDDLERTIASVWSEVLGHINISRNVSFFDIGGDSLSVMAALSHLKLDFLNLRMNDLYEHKTIKELAMHITALTVDSEQEDMTISEYKSLKELPVFPKIEVQGKDGLGSDILLTGATGYLGSHLIYELLATTKANIYVLVRLNWGRTEFPGFGIQWTLILDKRFLQGIPAEFSYWKVIW